MGIVLKVKCFLRREKTPKPSMYVSFGLNLKVSLTKEYDWLLPEFLGNKLMVARTTLSTRNIIVAEQKNLSAGAFHKLRHPLNEKATKGYLILPLTKISLANQTYERETAFKV